MESFEVIGLRLDIVIILGITGGLIALALTLWGVGALVNWKSKYSDGGGWFVSAGGVGVFSIIGIIISVCSFIPFQSAYHHWYSTAGTVESVTNIFEGGSGEISPGYVVELDTVDKPMVFTDPRILRELDEEVNVTCSLEWVPAGVDRLNCWLAK